MSERKRRGRCVVSADIMTLAAYWDYRVVDLLFRCRLRALIAL